MSDTGEEQQPAEGPTAQRDPSTGLQTVQLYLRYGDGWEYDPARGPVEPTLATAVRKSCRASGDWRTFLRPDGSYKAIRGPFVYVSDGKGDRLNWFERPGALIGAEDTELRLDDELADSLVGEANRAVRLLDEALDHVGGDAYAAA